MICKRCAIAGDMVAEARNMDLKVPIVIGDLRASPSIKETVGSVAHLFHGLCKGSDHCDCQHKVDFEGKTIQQ